MPPAFISLMTGLSLLGVWLSSLQAAFSDSSYKYAVMFTFLIAISNMSFLGVSSPVWALLIGILIAKLLGEGKKKEYY
ncbi:benzoate/H(+) symporter BenE family transporter [Paenibacillus sp. N3.4]|uniref:benzoate/H(+) symporter BenE family transporter n=1 Tax=Paenibacillus sp. N3.4 TaxID=2603222 RepID=UPI00164F6942|nr:benzoate/H(+) symporter BenE family transporter [Paenibacillus sp. N3.4]